MNNPTKDQRTKHKSRKPETMTDSQMRACHDHPCMENDLDNGDVYLYGKRWLRGCDGWWTEVIDQ